MKGLLIFVVQVLLVIAGGYYIYLAMMMVPNFGVEGIEMSASFMSSAMVGVILLGVAVMLQGIHQHACAG